MYSFSRGTIESILCSCITVRMAPAPFSAARTCSVLWEQLWRSLMSLFRPYWTVTTPASPEKPPGLQVSRTTISQSLQSAAVGEETAESPGQNQQAQRQFLPPGTPNAQLPPCSGPTLPCATTAPPTTDSGPRTLPMNTSNLRNYTEAVLFTSSLMFIVVICLYCEMQFYFVSFIVVLFMYSFSWL